MKKVLLLVLLITLIYGCSGDVDLGNPRFNASVDIPKGIDSSAIIVFNGLDKVVLNPDKKFTITDSKIVIVNDLDNRLIYLGFPGLEDLNGFRLNSKETALSFALKELPWVLLPENFKYIKQIKDVLYKEVSSIHDLEDKIQKTIDQFGYIKLQNLNDEIIKVREDLSSSLGYANYSLVENEQILTRDELGF